MRAWDELVTRCAERRRAEMGGLSDQAFEELLIAVRENPAAFAEAAPGRALLVLARALDAYRESRSHGDLLDDEAFEAERARRLEALRTECERALAEDERCLDARLVSLLAADLEPDPLLEGLLSLEREFARELPSGDAWEDVSCRPHLRLRAAVARTCVESSRFRMAQSAALSVMDASPSDPLGARHTHMLACARLEDEPAFDAVLARFSHRESAWSHLARVLLLYKLDRIPAARRALHGLDELCVGGAYALLRPAFVEIYLPDRPEASVCGLAECMMAVREAEPIIADVPDFINWCQGFDWLAASGTRFAEKNDLEW